MEITCEKNVFSQALATAARAINNRSPLPILSHVLLQAEDGRLRISATDLDLGVLTEVPTDITESGSVACPARLLMEIVSKLPSAPIRFRSHHDGRIDIHCGRSRFEISTLPAEEFPSLPRRSEGLQVRLPQKQFKAIIRRVGLAVASADESRAVMTGVLIKFSGNEMTMVATDGRRMACQIYHCADYSGEELQVIVPGRAMQEIVRLLSDGDEFIELSLADGQLHCQVNDVSLHCRLLEGTFPDYRRVLPKSFQRSCRIGREAFLGGLQRMLVLAQEKQSPNLVVLELSEGLMVISANTPDVGVGQEEIALVLEGEPLKIAFNGRYIADALSILEVEEIEIHFQDDSKSAVLSPYGEEGYSYVLMPVRLREAISEEVATASSAV